MIYKLINTHPPSRFFIKSGHTIIIFNCVGYITFLIIDELRKSLYYSSKFDIQFLILFFLLGSFFTCPAALVGGYILEVWLSQDAIKGTLTKKMAIRKGAWVGGITGFGVSMAVWGLVFVISNRVPDPWLFTFRTFIATFITLIIGSCIGRAMFNNLSK